MVCPRCRTENPPQAKFCLECATPLARRCTSCGTPLPPSAKFCLECAHPVGGVPGGPGRAPESYIPRHLAEKILTSRSAIEGERKQVTVLFADLKSSTELLADRDPEEARALLDPVLHRMMDAVHQYEGTVNQVMGDGIMALFGAPLAHEDHAVRACYAALRLQDSVKRYAEDVFRSHGVTVRMRVGLNSGDVVVRTIGNDLRMDYTAVGQTTHLAARMEQLADPGTPLLTAATFHLAEGYVEVRGRGPVPVRGLAEPVLVYELVGAAGVRSRLQAAAGRGLTRFVGRDAEMDQLRQALERAGAGHGQVAAVVGEPGVGKSRLYWEFTHSHHTQGWLILETGSVPYGKTAAYLPVIDLLRTYFQIEGRDDTRKIREKVTGKLLSLDRQLETALPALLSLLDVAAEDPAWESLEAPQRRQRTLDAVKRLLLRESHVQPLLVVFYDLHWIDTETQAWLDSLVEALPSSRVLLLVNYRPEYRHGWGNKTAYRQLRVDTLPADGADDLLEALLGADTALEPLRRTLILRTEGNPLFLEESVRTLVEIGALVGERGAYRLAKDPRSIQVPATVQAILAARIDRLSSEDKRLLQAASVIGKDVPFMLLQAIADLPDDALREALARLQTAEFLYERCLFPDLEYTFKHALTHEVTYGSVLQERRRTLHARIVDALEHAHAHRLDEHLETLAHHAFAGEVWDRAVHYLRLAATRAARRSANRESANHLERALVALRRLPESASRATDEIDVRLELRRELLPLGDMQRTVVHLRAAEELASTIRDDRRLGWVLAYLTIYFGGEPGGQDDAIACGQRARALGRATGDEDVGVMAAFFLGIVSLCAGSLADAVQLFEHVVTTLAGPRAEERFGEPGPPALFARAFLAWTFAELGRFDEAIAVGEESLRMAQAIDEPFTLMHGYFGVGIPYLTKGDLARAIPPLERDLALCRATDNFLWLGEIAADLGLADARAGRMDDALPVLEFALTEVPTAGLRWTYARQHAHAGEAYLLAGRHDEAARLAAVALEAARFQKQRGQEAQALWLSAEIAASASEAERAEADYRCAESLASGIGMRPLAARCHFGLARLYRGTGRPGEALDRLGVATAMYRQMDMRYWLEQATRTV